MTVMILIAIIVIAAIFCTLVKNWPLYQKDINELMREHDELMKMHDEDEW